MPGPAPQNLENHRRIVIPYHVVLFGLLLINLIYSTRSLISIRDSAHLVQLAVAVALIIQFFYARAFAISVQDRVIRLEMKLRLAAIAPDIMGRFHQFTVGQLTALRFAGDGELRGLAMQALEGKLSSGIAIKKEIRDWQADHWRA